MLSLAVFHRDTNVQDANDMVENGSPLQPQYGTSVQNCCPCCLWTDGGEAKEGEEQGSYPRVQEAPLLYLQQAFLMNGSLLIQVLCRMHLAFHLRPCGLQSLWWDEQEHIGSLLLSQMQATYPALPPNYLNAGIPHTHTGGSRRVGHVTNPRHD